jgi:3-oxoacyl-(acyl-carrier-protein) synthase
MKTLIPQLILITIFASCGQNTESLQSQLDSLKQNSYKPGFGEFMSNVQVHHAKLWFAGQNENWALADFEMHEIRETLESIQKYLSARKETQMLPIISLALDSVDNAIKQKNLDRFKSSYTLLTKTCNDCHVAANFGFNVVKIPETPPFSNQEFRTETK